MPALQIRVDSLREVRSTRGVPLSVPGTSGRPSTRSSLDVPTGAVEPTEPGNHPHTRGSDLAFRWARRPPRQSLRRTTNWTARASLENEGVIVKRPIEIDFSLPIRTPHFAVENQYCAVCPRDVMLTIGNEIIEATMSRRARYFEYEAYRGIRVRLLAG